MSKAVNSRRRLSRLCVPRNEKPYGRHWLVGPKLEPPYQQYRDVQLDDTHCLVTIWLREPVRFIHYLFHNGSCRYRQSCKSWTESGKTPIHSLTAIDRYCFTDVTFSIILSKTSTCNFGTFEMFSVMKNIWCENQLVTFLLLLQVPKTDGKKAQTKILKPKVDKKSKSSKIKGELSDQQQVKPKRKYRPRLPQKSPETVVKQRKQRRNKANDRERNRYGISLIRNGY